MRQACVPLPSAPDCGPRKDIVTRMIADDSDAGHSDSQSFANIIYNWTAGFIGRKSMSNIRIWAIAYAFIIVLVASATAQARQPFRVGGLTCSTGPRVGLVLGSRQDMRCVFVASGTGRQYAYAGTIRRLGLDLGVTRGGTLFWAVFARNSQIGRGTLRGNYVGASGNVAVGLGLGAKVLIGGSRRTISLQPLSVEGQIGLNLALGVTNLTLR
jgi:Protein of unknown function (DUF992)